MSSLKRNARSEKYQYLFLEIPVGDDKLNIYEDTESIGGRDINAINKERILDLQEQLKDRMFELMKIHATERQQYIVGEWMKGKTQLEMAKDLNVNQSSITKSINGNTSYGKNNKKQHGGLIIKMQKVCASDPQIQAIMEELSDLQVFF